jgi:hypothetical protein
LILNAVLGEPGVQYDLDTNGYYLDPNFSVLPSSKLCPKTF